MPASNPTPTGLCQRAAGERLVIGVYVQGRWRHFDGTSAGWGLHDWASHTVNLCQWVIDADATAPVEHWTEDSNSKLCARYANGVKLGRKLEFDPDKEKFVDAPDADALCSHPRRAPFTI